jgi:heterotetrameric sarcosine oxidase gamma subunit
MVDLALLAAPAFIPEISPQGEAIVALAPARSMASIALYGDDLKPILDLLGGALPLPGRQCLANGVRYLWSGPASWLALAEGDDPDFSLTLVQQLAGKAAVTDQSDGRVIMRVHGPKSRDVLAKLLPIDLHASVFAADATALTLAGHINVQIWRSGENGFELACFRSFAAALFEVLQAACREFQTGRTVRG